MGLWQVGHRCGLFKTFTAGPKKEMSDLSKDQLSILKKVVHAEFKNER
ncbi:MAG: hypothetical protein GY694_06460 [Gammaproteobacteria bacterium]|nr:hypothetical protein [Gammaproteobacteria bacterium]